MTPRPDAPGFRRDDTGPSVVGTLLLLGVTAALGILAVVGSFLHG